jgi:hypothetical protein
MLSQQTCIVKKTIGSEAAPMDIDSPLEPAVLQEYVALSDECDDTTAAVRAVQAHVELLEAKLAAWMSADSSRRWLSQSKSAGKRFELAAPTGTIGKASKAMRIKKSVVESVLFDVAEKACAGLVAEAAVPGLASQLAQAVLEAHQREPEVRVQRRRMNSGPKTESKLAALEPIDKQERELMELERKRNHIERCSEGAIDWPLLLVLKHRLGNLRARLKQARAKQIELEPGVAEHLTRTAKGGRLVLPDGSLAVRTSSRWMGMTEASLGQASFTFLVGKSGANEGSEQAQAVARVAQAIGAQVSSSPVNVQKRKRKRNTGGEERSVRGRWVSV